MTQVAIRGQGLLLSVAVLPLGGLSPASSTVVIGQVTWKRHVYLVTDVLDMSFIED